MNREQAVEYLTEVITKTGLLPEAFSLSATEKTCFKITIQTNDANLKKEIIAISNKYNFKISEEKGKIILSPNS